MGGVNWTSGSIVESLLVGHEDACERVQYSGHRIVLVKFFFASYEWLLFLPPLDAK